MDNNNQNRNGGKRPSGQNIGVLALILVITLIANAKDFFHEAFPLHPVLYGKNPGC